MAASKKASSAKKNSSSGRKNTASSGSRSKKPAQTGSRAKNTSVVRSSVSVPEKTFDPEEFYLFREAWLWFTLAVCVLILISYLGIGGYIGSFISDIGFGCFGTAAWAIPFLLFFTVVFVFRRNSSGTIPWGRVTAGILLALCVCGILELAMNGYQVDMDIRDLYMESTISKTGGGAVGAALCGLLCPAVGSAGALIIFLVFSIISIVLLTRRSIVRSVKDQGRAAVNGARENRIRRQTRRLERQEQIARWEEERTRRRREQARLSRQSVGTELTDPVPGTGADSQIFMTEYTAPARNRSQISSPEIPVIAGSHTGERRKHRASGGARTITMSGNTKEPVNEMQQLVPQKPASPKKKRPVVTRFPAKEEEPSFIDLNKEPEQGPKESAKITAEKNLPDVEAFQKQLNLHLGPEHQDSTEAEADGTAAPEPESVRNTASVEDPYMKKESAPAAIIPSSEGAEEEEDTMEGTVYAAGKDRSVSERTDSAAEAVSENTSAPDGNASPEDAQKKSARKNPRSSKEEIEDGISSVSEEISKEAAAAPREYVFPPYDLMKKGKSPGGKGFEKEMRSTAEKLQQTLDSFGVHATVTDVTRGPSVTRFELQPEQGVKVSRIVSLSDDIKLNLAATDIRIEAPIPGKSAVGIEVPNSENSAVMLRDLLESDEFRNHSSKMAFATGKDIGGRVIVSDLAKMPHLLIAGATGSGKSVCINTIVMSILYKAKPEEVRLIMIDPKVVELSVYNGIPHLLIPVVTDPKKAAGALNWAVAEMMDRYNKFAEMNVRDIKGYNHKIDSIADLDAPDKPEKLPQILIIVDELADLMMVAPGEVEDAICRLAQLARAAGIHLVIATQRPSVNVITGVIKANMPSRIAFQVSSGVDSRTILDMVGAEKLLGKGDMLFYPSNYQKPARIQGAFVSDEEVSDVVDFLKNENQDNTYNAGIQEKIQSAVSSARAQEDTDSLFAEAGKFIIEKDKASIGMLQRVFKIGFNRAARIMDQLSDAGVVGPEEGTKPRKILMNEEQFENFLENN